ncbi:MAG: hypothetical protein H0T60_03210 [Acidobacteria bacterium]|nr:hypothetical protein [Acidobacteriota bacterium]
MNFFKIIVGFLVLLLAVLGALMVYGIFVAAVKLLFYVGIIALVGAVAYKALRKPERSELGAWAPDLELEKTDRLLEEVKRRRLTE